MRRIAHALVLAISLSLVSLTLITSGASSQVHVEDEALAGVCDPCPIHPWAGTQTTYYHKILGMPISFCWDEFEGEVYEDGSGHLQLTQSTGSNCIIEPCTGFEAEWPIQVREAGWLRVDARLCFKFAGGDDVHCDITMNLDDYGTHDWHLTSNGYECTNGVPLSILGSWALEEFDMQHDRQHATIGVIH
jgi:hypothetical protein